MSTRRLDSNGNAWETVSPFAFDRLALSPTLAIYSREGDFIWLHTVYDCHDDVVVRCTFARYGTDTFIYRLSGWAFTKYVLDFGYQQVPPNLIDYESGRVSLTV